ncbi:hydrogenase expression/formation protein [Thiohalobacter sp. COW1]|uniref:Ni,Fe-hydrogenase maturation factor n=1 Tax=Thiohalobacter thiocyanaticus TaxID=585455 RepID=A0A1Z4VSP7_9GAMM|nr:MULTISPECIES: HyaD/HybD family hydrogenase maturation endopeptidase [Thiohalobacter]BAZ94661.1 Ni,Fe-hydrogenase maturation factor [Thiohalobacter thiocyanaticus]BCO30271.1 hydrogenase expression/formation protein [Thiohalobacter sp. COW1]
MNNNCLVLGLGNTLLSDEGVGVHVVKRLEEAALLDGNVTCMDGGTLSFTLAEAIESTNRLIVVDAAELNAAPGTVQVYENEGMDEFIGSNRKRSVHEVSLLDLLAIARLTDSLPQRRALVAIQPEQVDWGDMPTEAVQAAIEPACEAIHSLIQRWRQWAA